MLNVVTKSGGNELHGDVFGYFSDQSLQAQAPATEEFGQNLGFTNYDYGFDLGGKILQDRLWYFAALNPSATDDDFLNRQDLPFTERNAAALLRRQAHLEHRVAAPCRPLGVRRSEPDRRHQRLPGDVPALQHPKRRGAPRARFEAGRIRLRAHLRRHAEREPARRARARPLRAASGVFPVQNTSNPYVDNTSGGSFAVQQGCGDPALVASAGVSFTPGCLGGVWVAEDGTRSRNQLRAAVSYFLGSHSLKAGVEYRHLNYTDVARSAGPPSGPLIDEDGVVVNAEGVPGASFQLFPRTTTSSVWTMDKTPTA